MDMRCWPDMSANANAATPRTTAINNEAEKEARAPLRFVRFLQRLQDLHNLADTAAGQRLAAVDEGFIIGQPGLRLGKLTGRRPDAHDPGYDGIIDLTDRAHNLFTMQRHDRLA